MIRREFLRSGAALTVIAALPRGAFADTLFTPKPDAWRKWASAQIANEQYELGLQSLEHYLILAGARGQPDREAQQVAETLRGMIRGVAPIPAPPQRESRSSHRS